MNSELDKLSFLLNSTIAELKETNFRNWQVTPDNSSGMKGFTGEPELAVGSVLGYRWWKMYLPRQEALIGAYGGTWLPGKDVYEAKCTRYSLAVRGTELHAVPGANCGCGYWCYWKPDSAESVMGADKTAVFVQGVVDGFGVVLLGDKGFRAAKAKLRGLAIDVESLRIQVNRNRKAPWMDNRWGPRNLNTEGAVSTFAAMTGRNYDEVIPVPEELIMGAVAEMEGTLERLYPQAKVFSSLSTMRTYFGADKNYGYVSARNSELTELGKEYLEDALKRLAVVYCDLDGSYDQEFFYSEPLKEVKRMRALLQEILSEI